MLQVGIVGCGCIGSALAEWIRLHNPLLPVVIKDPDKGFFDALDAVSVVFVSIPVETKADGCQEISALEEVLMGLPDVPVFIRSTIFTGDYRYAGEETATEVVFYARIPDRAHGSC